MPRAGSHRREDEVAAITNGRGRGERDDLVRWQRALRSEDEAHALLHDTVITARRQEIQRQRERLARQRAFIRHEKRKLLLRHALLSAETERFEASLARDWFCLSAFPSAKDRVLTVDVGGQLFDISSSVAQKDGGSLLAAMADDADSPLGPQDCGCFRVDRDWRLFRYVLQFLRDGVLPQDVLLLRELYRECAFWKMNTLRHAIEARNLELLRAPDDSGVARGMHALLRATPPSSSPSLQPPCSTPREPLGPEATPSTGAWWQAPPAWWGATAEPKSSDGGAALASPRGKSSGGGGGGGGGMAAMMLKRARAKAAKGETAAAAEETAADAGEAWWTSAVYKGNDFAKPLTEPRVLHVEEDGEDKETTIVATPRSPLLLSSTWLAALRNETSEAKT